MPTTRSIKHRTKEIEKQLLSIDRAVAYLANQYTGHPNKETVFYYMESYMIAIEYECL